MAGESHTSANPDPGEEVAVTLPSDREIEMRREFTAPRTLVFDMWVQPQHVSRWMLGPDGWSMPVCEIDLRPGGTWHFLWRRADDTEMEIRGEYREIDPPARLVSTEHWGGDWVDTINTLELSEENSRTTMRWTLRYPTKADRDRVLASGMPDGAALSFNRLADLLAKLQSPEG